MTEVIPDELEALRTYERIKSQWEAGHLPPQELARLINLFPRLFEDLIRTRQQLTAARAEAGTLPLLSSPNQTHAAHV